MSRCACDGTTDTFQALPDAVYHAAGTTSPTEDAIQACQQAAALMRAQQLDPCDSNYDEVLQMYFQQALTLVGSVVSTTPNSNPLQDWFDKTIGTTAPGTPLAPKPPQPASTNWTFIAGAIALLILGFVLVFA